MKQISFKTLDTIRVSLSDAHIWIYDEEKGYYHLDNQLDKAKIYVAKVAKGNVKRLKTARNGFTQTINEGLEFLQTKPDNTGFILICQTSSLKEIPFIKLEKLDNSRISISICDKPIITYDFTKMVALTPIQDETHAQLVRLILPQISFRAIRGVESALVKSLKTTIDELQEKLGLTIYIHPKMSLDYENLTYKILCVMHTIHINIRNTFPNLITEGLAIPTVKELYITTSSLEGDTSGRKVLANYQHHLKRLTLYVDRLTERQFPEVVIYHELSHALDHLVEDKEQSNIRGTHRKKVLELADRKRYINRITQLATQGKINPRQMYYLTGESEFFARFLEMYFTRTYLQHITSHNLLSVFPEEVPSYQKAIKYLQSI